MKIAGKKFILLLIFSVVAIGLYTSYGMVKNSAISIKTKHQLGTGTVTTIKVALWDYDIVGYDKKLIKAFMKKFPNIKVQVVSIKAANYENRLAAMLDGGEYIDVFYARTSSFFKRMVSNTNIRAIDDLIARDKINLKKYREITRISNKIYGLPYRSDFTVMYYNKDIFDKNKIEYPKNQMTWEEYRALGKRLTYGNGENKVYGILTNPILGSFILPKEPGNKAFDLVSSDLHALKPGLELMMGIQNVDKSAVDYITNISRNVDQVTFEKGKSGMFINGSWYTNYLVKDGKAGKINFKWGIVKPPLWEKEKYKQEIYSTPVCINPRTTKLEEAWNFEKFIAGREGSRILIEEMIIPGILDHDTMNAYYSNKDFPRESKKVLELKNTYEPKYYSGKEKMIMKVIFEQVQEVIGGNKSVDAGIRDMINNRDKILKISNKPTMGITHNQR